MRDRTAVRVATGDGYLARRATELVFSPTDSDVVRVFDSAPDGQAIDAVTAHAEEHDFEVGDFVIVEWSSEMRVAVFGEIEVTSDHRSLPRLSAAGAGTWVERSIRRADGEITIGVAVGEVDDATDLHAGIVQAGGFALTCNPGSTPTRLPELIAEREVESDTPTPQPEPVGESVPSVDSASPEPAVSDPEPTVTPTSVVSDPPASSSATAAEALAASVLDGPPHSPAFAAAPDDETIVPDDAMRNEISALVGETPRPPTPTEWSIVFADGAREDIDRRLVLGRKPTLHDGETDATTRLLTLDCTQVSSRHLAVEAVGGAITVTDLGSSNGSFVLTTGDGQLVQLEPGAPHQIDVGMIVQTGTKTLLRRSGRSDLTLFQRDRLTGRGSIPIDQDLDDPYCSQQQPTPFHEEEPK